LYGAGLLPGNIWRRLKNKTSAIEKYLCVIIFSFADLYPGNPKDKAL
jgi:hypothetical protein